MATTLNVTAERGTAEVITFTAASAAATDKILFRINSGNYPVLLKASTAYNGQGGVVVNAGVSYQVTLSIDELYQLPDSTTYKLIKFTVGETETQEVLYAGTISTSGEIPDEIAAMQVTNWQNGNNFLDLGSTYTASLSDDDVIHLSGSAALSLPDPPETVNGKIFTIHNGLGEAATITNLGGGDDFVIADGDSITVVAISGKWEKIGGNVHANTNTALTTTSKTIADYEEIIVVSSTAGAVAITLPSDRSKWYGKRVIIYKFEGSNTVSVIDGKTDDEIIEALGTEKMVELYLPPSWSDSMPWIVINQTV